MIFNFPQSFSEIMASASLTIAVLNIIIHFVFAAGVANDSGYLVKSGRTTYLVSGITWAFATLLGGVLIAALYWAMHHSSLARTDSTKKGIT